MKRYLLAAFLLSLLASPLLSCNTFLPERLPNQNAESAASNANFEQVKIIASGLDVPWAMAFLPNGSIILTERKGTIRLIDVEKGLLAEPLAVMDGVAARGEGGLLGLALHPGFGSNGLLYVYYTYQDGARLKNKVVRFRLENMKLAENQTIIDGIPGANIHNGGRLKFGPDQKLYITTGDAASPELAQDKDSLAGKILRLNDDGSIPPDNPLIDSSIFSFGHRNPQGLAWDDDGQLWDTEHGSSAFDELNLIVPGANYGWPSIRGDDKADGMASPMLHSGAETWAPSGLAYLNGDLFFVGLRGQALFQVAIQNGKPTLRKHLSGEYGRLRDVVVGADGMLYIMTNNRDGRGSASGNDDLVLQVDTTGL